jgi:hypothetical protein
MAVKRYNGTSWDTVAGAGTPGAAGIVTSATAPSNTAVLWADTTVTTNNALIPAGGTTNQVLTKSSSSDYATQWATPAGGKVLQVVYNSYNLGVTTTSTSLVDTGLSATITPTSATSKILVIVSQNGCGKNATTAGRLTLAILRTSTVLQYLTDVAGYTNDSAINYFNNVSGTYLDAPATTSATTYKTQFLSEGGSAVYVNDTYANTYKSASTITLMEIGA